MTLRSLTERARRIVAHTLFSDEEPEVGRMLVAGAVVAREGEHYRIEMGGETWEDLQTCARHQEGLCDCGALLSTGDGRSRCRTCGREFRN